MTKIMKNSKKAGKVAMSTALIASSLSIATPIVNAEKFTDVDPNNVHASDINDLANRNILNGFGDGTFRPTENVTRGQAAKIIANILDLNLEEAKNPNFKDVPKSHIFYKYIAALAEKNIIQGWDGNYNPDAPITRGQMAKIIAMAFDLKAESKEIAFKDVPKDHQFAPFIQALFEHEITYGVGNDLFNMDGFVKRDQMASFVVRAEKSSKVNTISGQIQSISENEIVIDGVSYKVSEKISFLLEATNKNVLQGATIEVSTKNNQIEEIKNLSLNASGTLNGKGQSIDSLKLLNEIQLKNITAEYIEIDSVNAPVYFEHVAANEVNIKSKDSVAALENIKSPEAELVFESSSINNLNVDAKLVNATANKSTITHFTTNALQINLQGVFEQVTIKNNAELQGQAQIKLLEIDSLNNESPKINVSASVNVENVFIRVAGIVMSYEEAINNNILVHKDNNSANLDNSKDDITNNNSGIQPASPENPNNSSNIGNSNQGTGNQELPQTENQEDNSNVNTENQDNDAEGSKDIDDTQTSTNPEDLTGDKEINPENQDGSVEENDGTEEATGTENTTENEETDTENQNDSIDDEKPQTEGTETTTDTENQGDDDTQNPDLPSESVENNDNNSTNTDSNQKDEETAITDDSAYKNINLANVVIDEEEMTIQVGNENIKIANQQVADFLLNDQRPTDIQLDLAVENGEIVGIENAVITVADNEKLDGAGLIAESITINGAVQEVSNITATKSLDVEAGKEIHFNISAVPEKIVIHGEVEKISNLKVSGSLEIKSSGVVVLQDVSTEKNATISVKNAQEIVVDEAPRVASRSTVASLNSTVPVASLTGQFEITFANTTSEKLTIKRNSTVVDIKSSTVFDSIDMLGDYSKLQSELKLTNVYIGLGVTNFVLNADVTTLALTIDGNTLPIKMTGTGKITDLSIKKDAENPSVLDIQDIKNNITNIIINDSAGNYESETIFKKPGSEAAAKLENTSFSKYKIVPIGTTTITKYAQIEDGIDPGTVTQSQALSYVAGTEFLLYHTTKYVVVFDSNNVKTVINLEPRTTHTLLKSFNKNEIILNSTFKPGTTLEDTLKFIVVLEFGGVRPLPQDLDLSAYTWELDSKTGYSTVTLPIKNNMTREYMLVYDKQVDSYMNESGTYFKDAFISLANEAKRQNKPEIMYGPLVKYSLTQNTTFDSLLLQKYVDAIVANQAAITTIDDIKSALENVEASTNYQYEAEPQTYYLSNANLTFEYSNPNVVRAEVQSGKIIFVPESNGKTTIKMTDSEGNSSLVFVDNTTGTMDEPSLVKINLATNHSLIEGTSNFRVVEAGANRYALPTSFANTSAISQNTTNPTQLEKIVVSESLGEVSVSKAELATTTITYDQLGLTNKPSVLNDGTIGTVITDTAIHAYAIQDGLSNFVIKANEDQATAVQLKAVGDTVTIEHIASTNNVEANQEIETALSLGSINPAKVEKLTTTNAIHAHVLNGKISFYASAAGKTSFKVTDVADKTAVVNVEATVEADGKVVVSAKTVTQSLPTGSANIVFNQNPDVLYYNGDKLIASAVGSTLLTLNDGKQYEVTVTYDEANGYKMSEPKLVKGAAITPQMVDLSKIEGPTGTSYASLIEGMLIVKLPDNETTKEIVITSGNDSTQKAVVVVSKDANGDYSVQPVRKEIEASELGLTKITAIEGEATSSYRVVENAGKVYVYGFGTTGGSYKIIGEKDGVAATGYINISPSQSNGSYSVNATPAMHTISGYTLAADSPNTSVVRIDGNKLYATDEGYVELPLDDGSFYTLTVSKGINGQYTFSEPVIVSRQSYSLAELGLATITGVSSNNAEVATATVNESNKVVVATGKTNGSTVITVTGTYNGATVVTSIFAKREGNILTAVIEKNATPNSETPPVLESTINFSKYGHSTINLNGITWLSDGIVRPTANGTTVDFFVIGNGDTAGKITSEVTTLVNFVAGTGSKGERIVTADVLAKQLGESPEIISGSNIVRIGADGKTIYAINLGTAVVKVSTKVYELKVATSTDGKQYTYTEQEVQNAKTITASTYGLEGTVSNVVTDTTKVQYAINGNEIILTPVAAGKTALVIETSTGKSIVNVTISGDSLQITDDGLNTAVLTTSTSPELLHSEDNQVVRIDGNTIYAVGEGIAELLVDNGTKTVVAKVEVKKESDGTYSITTPTTISELVLDATTLGLSNTLSLNGSEHALNKVYATIKDDQLIAYGLANGSSLITVKDVTGNKTIVQVKQEASGFTYEVATAAIDDSVKSKFDFDDVPVLSSVDGKARFKDGQLYLLEQGYSYGVFTQGTKKALGSIDIKADESTGWLSAEITAIEKTNVDLGGNDTTQFTAMPNSGTNTNIIRISNDGKKLIATGLGSTSVQLGDKVLVITVAKDAITNEVKMTHSVTSSKKVLAADAGFTKIEGFTDISGNSIVTGTKDGNDYILYAKSGVENATSQIRITDGTDYAIVNVKVDGSGNLVLADAVKYTIDDTDISVNEIKSNSSNGVRAVWSGNQVTFYATEKTIEKSLIRFTDATANVEVKESAGLLNLTAAFKSFELSGVGYVVSGTAIISSQELVDKTVFYAKSVGTALLRKDKDLYVATVSENGSHIDLSVSDKLTLEELDITNSSYTIANVSGATVNAKELDANKLVLYSENDGQSDLVVTSNGEKSLYYVKTTNKVTIADLAMKEISTIGLPTDVTTATITSGTAARISGNEFYFLGEGNIAVQTDKGIFNGKVTRGATGEFQVAWTTQAQILKEAINLNGAAEFNFTDTTLTALALTGEQIFYSTNYRVSAKTILDTTSHEYKLVVNENRMARSSYSSQGLDTSKTITAVSLDSSKVKAEVNGTDIIVYAVTSETFNETITVSDGTKNYAIYANYDGVALTLNVVGTQINYADLGLSITSEADLEKLSFEVNSRTASPIQVEKGTTSLNITSISTGAASILVKYNNQAIGIVNVTVAQDANNKLVTNPTIVKTTLTGSLIHGNDLQFLNGSQVIGTGTLLYKVSETKANMLKVSKDGDGLYYVDNIAMDLNAVTNEQLKLVNLSNVEVITKNDTIANAVIHGDSIYIYGVNNGTTNIYVRDKSTHKDLAIIQTLVDGNGVTPIVASAAAPTTFGTDWTDTAHVLVRDNTFFAINEGSSALKVSNGTNSTIFNTTVSIQNGEYKIVSNPVDTTFSTAATVVTSSDIVYSVGTTVYAQKVGTAKVEVNGQIINVSVSENADGTFKIEQEAQVQPQKVISASEVGLAKVQNAVTDSAVIETQLANVDNVAGDELVVIAKQPGEISFEINDGAGNKAIAYAKVISSNGVLSFDGDIQIAKASVSNGTFTSNAYVRADGNTLYGLQEGASIVNATETDGAALYKVIVSKSGARLNVETPTRIESAELGGTPTDLTDATVARIDGNKLVALQTNAQTDFKINDKLYRFKVDTEGTVVIESLSVDTIDATNILSDNITAVTSSTLFDSEINGKTVTIIPKAIGTETIAISAGSESIQAKVEITSDGANGYTTKTTILKQTILGTDLGFYVDETKLPTISNAIVKFNGGNIDIYPGATIGQSQLVVKGLNDKQAIYDLNITGLGEFTLKPLTSEIEITNAVIDIVPTAIVDVVGNAKATLVGNKIVIQYLDTDVAYVIVKDANGQYRTIDVQATAVGNSFVANAITSTNVKKGLGFAADVTMLSSGIEKVMDGAKAVLYVKDAALTKGTFAYEGKLYNISIANRELDIPTEVTATTANTSASMTSTLVEGDSVALVENHQWVAKAVGHGVYKTNDGHYVDVEVKVVNNEYVITALDLASATYDGVTNIVVIDPSSGLKADGSTIYGNSTGDIILKGLKDGKAVMYAGESISTLEELVIDVNSLIGWSFDANNGHDLSSSSTQARIEGTKLYITDFSDQPLVIKFAGESGITKTLTFDLSKSNVINQIRVSPPTLNNLVTVGNDTLVFEVDGLNSNYVNITFSENVDLTGTTIQASDIFFNVDGNKISISNTKSIASMNSSNLKITIKEWNNSPKTFDINLAYDSTEGKWNASITDPVNPALVDFVRVNKLI